MIRGYYAASYGGNTRIKGDVMVMECVVDELVVGARSEMTLKITDGPLKDRLIALPMVADDVKDHRLGDRLRISAEVI